VLKGQVAVHARRDPVHAVDRQVGLEGISRPTRGHRPQTTLAAHGHLAHALCGPQQVGQLLDGQALLGVFALALAVGNALKEIGLGQDGPVGRGQVDQLCADVVWLPRRRYGDAQPLVRLRREIGPKRLLPA